MRLNKRLVESARIQAEKPGQSFSTAAQGDWPLVKSYYRMIEKSRKSQQKRIVNHARATDCYSFFNLLTGPERLDFVESQLAEHRQRLYPPAMTLSLFMTQALSSDGSCQNAVNGYVVGRDFHGLEPCSSGTGAYCKARKNLPLERIGYSY